jgi:hypothetical protein
MLCFFVMSRSGGSMLGKMDERGRLHMQAMRLYQNSEILVSYNSSSYNDP